MKLVRENIDFRRGKDSREALSIGKGRVPYLIEFDKLAKQYGFHEIEIPVESIEDDPHLNFLAAYKNDKGKIIEVYIVPQAVDFKNPLVYYNNKERDITTWTPKFWEAIIGRKEEMPPYTGLEESIDFKRGINSKEALDIGEYRKIYAPINWDFVSPGYYMAYNNELAMREEYCIIEVKKMAGDTVINRLTHWRTNINSLLKKERLANRMFQDAKEWEQSIEITSIEKIDIPKRLSESLEFQRGLNSKDSIGVGIKETNRDLEALAQNFQEHFDKYTFLEHVISRRDKGLTKYGIGKYPIFFMVTIDSMQRSEFELDRKRKRFKSWINKYTPYIIKSENRGHAFVNKKTPSGYQMSYTFYLDDK